MEDCGDDYTNDGCWEFEGDEQEEKQGKEDEEEAEVLASEPDI